MSNAPKPGAGSTRRGLLTIVVLAILALVPSAASAASIVFVKGGDRGRSMAIRCAHSPREQHKRRHVEEVNNEQDLDPDSDAREARDNLYAQPAGHRLRVIRRMDGQRPYAAGRPYPVRSLSQQGRING